MRIAPCKYCGNYIDIASDHAEGCKALTTYTKYFQNVRQVEHVFGRVLDLREIEFVHAYIRTGVRPNPNGCWHCTESEMLLLTDQIDKYEALVEAGLAQDPRDVDPRDA